MPVRRTAALASLSAALAAVAISPVAIPFAAPPRSATAPASSAPAATQSAAAWPDSPVAAGEKPVKLAGDFKFTEGATSDEKGNIFFVDQNNDRIMEWTVDSKLVEWMHPSGYSNGMCFDGAGNLISCADEKNELWSITPDKKVTVLIKDNGGKPLNGPNDVWVRPDGGMYLTDPLYGRTWWTARPGGRGMQQAGQYVYYFSPDHKVLTPVVTDFQQPNGIIGTPDGKMLYVSDIRGRKTWSYTIHDDGTLGDKKLFCNAGSDGMTIDSDGNVYTTGGTMGIWDKTGKQIDSIKLPKSSANVCFGGADGHLLFICAGTEVYGVKMKTKRVGPQ